MKTIFDFNPEGVIIDAGSFPENPVALSWLDKGLPVVCCDGAADTFLSTGRIPWRIVGDCDSLSDEVKNYYAGIIRRFPDQETNDQTKSVRYFSSKGIKKIVILGATGLREDHSLGNISLLVEYLKHGIEARIYTDHGVFIPVKDTFTFEAEPGTQVSIFNFGARCLRAEGLRYPIRDFENWWEGTLNEVISPRFTIHASGYLLIFLTYTPKD